jgi:hypothetical protein
VCRAVGLGYLGSSANCEDATKFEDIFGLGFSTHDSLGPAGRLSTEAKDVDVLSRLR